MGYNVTTFSSAVRIYEEPVDPFPEIIRKYVYEGEPLVDQLIAYFSSAVNGKMTGVIDHARDFYTYGLPTDTFKLNEGYVDEAALQIVMDGIAGTPVEILSSRLALVEPEFIASNFLVDTRGWDPVTDIILNEPPNTDTTFQHDTVFISAEWEMVETVYNLYEHTWSVFNPSGNILLTYELTRVGGTSAPITVTEVFVVTPAINQSIVYYQVVYRDPLITEVNELGVTINSNWEYWLYNPATNVHPTLVPFVSTNQISDYYPIVPFRRNDQNLADKSLKDTELFKTSRALMKKMGLDFETIANSIDESPSANDIDHAYLYFGVPIDTDEPTSLNYMYDYFDYLNNEWAGGQTKESFEAWLLVNRSLVPPQNSGRIEDAGLKIELVCNYINKETKSGSIGTGAIGDTARIVNAVAPTRRSVSWGANDDREGYKEYDTSTITMQRQITIDTYDEITISGFTHKNYIYGEYAVVTGLQLGFAADNDNFLIPLNASIVAAYSNDDKVLIHYAAMHIVVNGYNREKIVWWKQLLKAILVIIVFILIIYSLGNLLAFAHSLATAGSWSAAGSLLLAGAADLAVAAFWGEVIIRAGTLLVAQWGLEGSFLVQVLLVATMIYMAWKTGNFEFLHADKMIWAVTAMSSGIKAEIDKDLREISAGNDTLIAEDKELTAIEERFAEDFDTGAYISTSQFYRNSNFNLDPTEDPSKFYHRKIHAGNPGVTVLDYASSYVAMSLELPKDFSRPNSGVE